MKTPSKPAIVGSTKVKPFGLGEYSNNPKEYEAQVGERQEAVVVEVGDFFIQRTPQHRHWVARTKTGKPLPKPLEGLWLSPETFANAAVRFQGKGEGV